MSGGGKSGPRSPQGQCGVAVASPASLNKEKVEPISRGDRQPLPRKRMGSAQVPGEPNLVLLLFVLFELHWACPRAGGLEGRGGGTPGPSTPRAPDQLCLKLLCIFNFLM